MASSVARMPSDGWHIHHESEGRPLSGGSASALIQIWRGREVEGDAARGGVGEMVRILRLNSSPWPITDQRLSPTSPPTNCRIASGGRKMVRLRGRKEMEGLVLRMKKDRLREIADLAKKQRVSRFPFRGRIQSLVRLRSLRLEVCTIKEQQWSQIYDANQKDSHGRFSSTASFRDMTKDTIQQIEVEGHAVDVQVHSPDSRGPDFDQLVNFTETEDTQYPESVSTIELGSSPPEALFTTPTSEEDLHGCQKANVLSDERISWENSNDLKQSEDSSVLRGCQEETVMEMEDVQAFTEEQQPIYTNSSWLSEHTNSWRGQENIRKTFNHDFPTAFNNNVEIQALLERRTVSNLLASDFPHKLNKMIMSFIQKKSAHYGNESVRDESDEQTISTQPFEDYSDQDTSTSSIVQLSQESYSQERCPSCSFNRKPSMRDQDVNSINDLRDELTQIRGELLELKTMVESCLEWKTNVECSIKNELSSSIDQLVEREKSSLNTKWMPGYNDTCCICYEAQIDTLLYRCGHMCACFKCSQGLHLSNSSCPICHSTIIDVVQAYPSS